MNSAQRTVKAKVVDEYAQHALASYRGYVQVFTSKAALLSKQDLDGDQSGDLFDEFLCEMPIVLPKVGRRFW